MSEHTYIGKGKVFLAKRQDDKLRFVGNSDKVELSFSEETKEIKDFTQAGGGTANSVSRVDKVEIGLNLFDFSPENLALAVFGEATQASASSIIAESHTVYKGRLTRLKHSHICHVVVKDPITDKVYQEGIDFEVLNSGVLVLESSSIEDGAQVAIDYAYGASNVIQALVNSGDEYCFVFDGLNEARSGKRVVLEIYRVKFTPASSLSFIGDDFGNIEISGTALSDNSKTGLGISRYFKVEMEQ